MRKSISDVCSLHHKHVTTRDPRRLDCSSLQRVKKGSSCLQNEQMCRWSCPCRW